MSIGNEILTLQFGHYSNYIGAHWLNIQEAGFSFNPDFLPEINNDILFREGISNVGESTYTPRLLLVDFKKSLGHLETPSDFHQVTETVNWDRDKIDNLMEDVEFTPNEYLKDAEALKNNGIPLLKSSYDLDDSVSTWSDYIVQPLHCRSVNVINGYYLGVNHTEFCSYSLGVSLWNENYFQEDFTDKIRIYIEECDNLQGMHVLVDADNGFSGLSSKCIEYLRDEYGKKSIFTIPSYNYDIQCEGINTKKKDLNYILNVMAGMSQFADFSDLIAPVSLFSSLFKKPRLHRTYKNLVYKPDSNYHTSAIIAMALDSITLPYRTRDSFSRMNDMIRAFATHGRQVAAVGINFPFPMTKEDKLITTLEKWEQKWFESLSPEISIDVENVTTQFINIRGIGKDSLHKESPSSSGDTNPAYACKSVEEMLSLFFRFSFDNAKSSVKSIATAVRIPPTYPRIFNEVYNMSNEPENPWGRLAELRVLASLHSTLDTQNFLKEILSPSRTKVIESLASSCGINPTDFTEMQENIERLMSCYNDSSWML